MLIFSCKCVCEVQFDHKLILLVHFSQLVGWAVYEEVGASKSSRCNALSFSGQMESDGFCM